MNLSVPVSNTMEYIKIEEISPLISKVLVKVCYVGQSPNRNNTVITKEAAYKLARGLHGCPIVGYYNEKEGDFESHNHEIVVEDGKYRMIDTTKPYGFVDTNAKIWFQKFIDDGIEHEYLCTEGYLWTGIYEESQRVVDKGNNQSMELSEKYDKGFWSKDINSGKRIFIINESLIEKLCILGSNVEPCFEGARITSYALDAEEFKTTMYSMINELKDALSKGGYEIAMENEKDLIPQTEEQPIPVTEYKKDEEDKEDVKQEKDESSDDKEKKKKEDEEDYACGGGGSKDDEKKKKKGSYEVTCKIEDTQAYVELSQKYSELQSQYSALDAEYKALIEEANGLREFKKIADRKAKEDMIGTFYMLSDEDKKDVIDNIDTYSLDDIEAKLSIICVRNKVNFNLEEQEEEKPTTEYMLNLASEQIATDDAPAWVRRVRNYND